MANKLVGGGMFRLCRQEGRTRTASGHGRVGESGLVMRSLDDP